MVREGSVDDSELLLASLTKPSSGSWRADNLVNGGPSLSPSVPTLSREYRV
jgi:hypothetical protein